MRRFETVCIVGAGKMGSYVAVEFAGAGCRVKLFDSSTDSMNKSPGLQKYWIAHLQESGRLKESDSRKLLSSIEIERDIVSAARDAELVSENVSESLDVKQTVLREVEQYAPDNSILTTNTSMLHLSELAAHMSRPECFAALHFNQPSGFVDLVPSETCSKSTLDRLTTQLRGMNLTWATPKREIPGYIYNNVNNACFDAALLCWMSGLGSFSQIDRRYLALMEDLGSDLSLGPFGRIEKIGLNVAISGMEAVCKRLCRNKKTAPRRIEYYLHILDVLREFQKAGCFDDQAKPVFEEADKFRAANVRRADLLSNWMLQGMFVEAISLVANSYYEIVDIDRCWMQCERTGTGLFDLMRQIGLKKVYLDITGFGNAICAVFGEEDNTVIKSRLAAQFVRQLAQGERNGDQPQASTTGLTSSH